MIAPWRPIEKVTPWEGFLLLTSVFKTGKDIQFRHGDTKRKRATYVAEGRHQSLSVREGCMMVKVMRKRRREPFPV